MTTPDPKEFLRRAFNNGNYDVTDSDQEVIEFCQLFSGEPEAQMAFDISERFLSGPILTECRPHLP